MEGSSRIDHVITGSSGIARRCIVTSERPPFVVDKIALSSD
jgi:hypothetical protein